MTPILLSCALVSSSQGALIITGVIDGDLTGGLPKAIVLTATTDEADLSIFGVGSANNGGGTDGEEFTLAGSVSAGDVIVIASNTTSQAFFTDNYFGLTVLIDGAANINGDDAIELFQSGAVIDTYGDINVAGSGETWEYRDGYAVRTGGSAGAFDQANYDSQLLALDGQDEVAQASILQTAFGFTPVPEPSSALLSGLALMGLLRRRR